MELNTYRSGTTPEVYVTMPAVEAAAIFTLVDCLAPLQLAPVRCGYTISEDERDLPFLEAVTLEIGAIGYAVHGYGSGSFLRGDAKIGG